MLECSRHCRDTDAMSCDSQCLPAAHRRENSGRFAGAAPWSPIPDVRAGTSGLTQRTPEAGTSFAASDGCRLTPRLVIIATGSTRGHSLPPRAQVLYLHCLAHSGATAIPGQKPDIRTLHAATRREPEDCIHSGRLGGLHTCRARGEGIRVLQSLDRGASLEPGTQTKRC